MCKTAHIISRQLDKHSQNDHFSVTTPQMEGGSMLVFQKDPRHTHRALRLLMANLVDYRASFDLFIKRTIL